MPLIRTRAFFRRFLNVNILKKTVYTTNYRHTKANSMLPAEIIAPDFELYSTPDQKLKLRDLRNRKVILAFYPADWSPVCDDQMTLYNEMGKYFARRNAQLIGISVDSKWSHLAFIEHN